MNIDNVSLAVGGSFVTLLVGVLSLVAPHTSVSVPTDSGMITPRRMLALVDEGIPVVPEPQVPEKDEGVAVEQVPRTRCPFSEGIRWEVVLPVSERHADEDVLVDESIEYSFPDVSVRPGTYRVHVAAYAPTGGSDRPVETWALHLLDERGATVAESVPSRPLKAHEEEVVEILEPYLTVPREATAARVIPSGTHGERIRHMVPLCIGLEPVALEGAITIEAIRMLDVEFTTHPNPEGGVPEVGVLPDEGVEPVASVATSGTAFSGHVAAAGTSQAKRGTLALLLFFVSILVLLVAVHAQPKGAPEVLSTY